MEIIEIRKLKKNFDDCDVCLSFNSSEQFVKIL